MANVVKTQFQKDLEARAKAQKAKNQSKRNADAQKALSQGEGAVVSEIISGRKQKKIAPVQDGSSQITEGGVQYDVKGDGTKVRTGGAKSQKEFSMTPEEIAAEAEGVTLLTPEQKRDKELEDESEAKTKLGKRISIAREKAQKQLSAGRGLARVQGAVDRNSAYSPTDQQTSANVMSGLSDDFQASEDNLNQAQQSFDELIEQNKLNRTSVRAEEITTARANLLNAQNAHSEILNRENQISSQLGLIMSGDTFAGMTPAQQQAIRSGFAGFPEETRNKLVSDAVAANAPKEFSDQIKNTESASKMVSQWIINKSKPDTKQMELLAENSLYTTEQIALFFSRADDITNGEGTLEEKRAKREALASEIQGEVSAQASSLQTAKESEFSMWESMDDTQKRQWALLQGRSVEQIEAMFGDAGFTPSQSTKINWKNTAKGMESDIEDGVFNISYDDDYETTLSRVEINGEKKPGKQCAEFVNDAAGTSLGSLYNEKSQYITHQSEDAKAGDIFVQEAGKYGHTGFISKVYDLNGVMVADTIEFNRELGQKRSDQTAVPLSEFSGFIENKNANNAIEEAKPMTADEAYAYLAEKNKMSSISSIPAEDRGKAAITIATRLMENPEVEEEEKLEFSSEAKGKSFNFGSRMQDAHLIINELEGSLDNLNPTDDYLLGYDWLWPGVSGLAVPNVPFVDFPESWKSDKEQLFEQASRTFVNAILRKESGAAINKDEFDSAILQYFPQPADSDTVIAQKRITRQSAIDGLFIESGYPGYQQKIIDEHNIVKNIQSAINNPTRKAKQATDDAAFIKKSTGGLDEETSQEVNALLKIN